MVNNRLAALLCIFFLVSIQAKLTYVFGLARHGAIYPKNDLYDGNQTKQFRGMLTPIGQRMTYNLGTYLQSDYILKANLTNSTFNHNQVQFYSTSLQRTQMSALSFLYGLFPLQQGWRLPQGIQDQYLQPPFKVGHLNTQQETPFGLNKGFQPLPVRPLDSILNNCPNWNQLLAQRLKQIADPVNAFSLEQFSFRQKIGKILNLSDYSIPVLCQLFQTLESDKYLGRKMPAEYSIQDHKRLKYINQYYKSLVFDGNLGRVSITPISRMLRAKIGGAARGQLLKLSFTFGHQDNIHPLLTQLRLTSAECLNQQWNNRTVTSDNCVSPPQFAASFILELHQQDQISVRVRYNGDYVYLCGRKQKSCPYTQFVSRLAALQTNYEKQCGIAEVIVQQL